MESEIWQKNRDRGLVVLGVNAREQGDPHALARGFVREHGVTYPTLMDLNDEMSQAYQIEAFPSVAILDRQGTLRYLQPGFDGDAVVTTVNQLLQESPQPSR